MDNHIEIVALEYPTNVRTRPGMYIGSLDDCSVMLREVVDNSIDEIYNYEKCNLILIDTSFKEGTYYVLDNGRGIPINWDDKHGMTKCQLATSNLHAGSKFNKTQISIGMNGVGNKVVNALSDEFVILAKITEFNHDKSIPETKGRVGDYYQLKYQKGIKISEGVVSRSEVKNELPDYYPEDFSTCIYFTPDTTIFRSSTAELPIKNLTNTKLILKEFHNKPTKFLINNEEITSETSLNKFTVKHTITIPPGHKNTTIDILISWDFSSNLSDRVSKGSVNSIQVDRGKHIRLAEWLIANCLAKEYDITHDYLYPGLQTFVVVLAAEPDFSSQTKENLTDIDRFGYDEINQLRGKILDVFRKNKEYLQFHVNRLNELAKSLQNISTINKIKDIVKTSSKHGDKVRSYLPKNVSDCSTPSRNEAELIITEGNSAGGNLMKVRDVRYHAIMALRGKPMNTINRSIEDVLNNREMEGIIKAIGLGTNDWNDTSNPRYGKIIIGKDADPDGASIAALVVGAIATHMTFLLKAGMVYVADTPIYKQDGKFIYPDDVSMLDRNKPFNRFKGLGELDEDEIYDAILNPATRRLIKITPNGIYEALSYLTSSYERKNLMINSGILINPYNVE